jgi:hypothetical protein
MTEQRWLASADPQKMLESLRGKTSDRKLRLFACAYGRAVRDSQHLLGPSTAAVAERYADGLAGDQDLSAERRGNGCFPEERWPVAPSAFDGARGAVDWLARYRDLMRIDPDALRHCPVPLDDVGGRSVLVLRDIFGNPFHLVTLSPAWLTPQVIALAQAAYDHRELPAGTLDVARLAVLADALEEVGCTDPDILNHCRRPGVHVRGCWVVDLLLGEV